MQPFNFNLCQFFGFIFASYCVVQTKHQNIKEKPKNPEKFEIEYQWSHINFTWHSPEEYKNAVLTKKYIPENNVPAGVKFYKERFYIALPRIRRGSPVTLAYISKNAVSETNPLLKPYPSWKMNARNDCTTLQNVQSMEIDSAGIMWVLDGNRFNDFTTCPPKIVLFDLNNKGRVVQSYNFPNEICLREGGFLNDLVIDENDGGFAYITDNSDIDPGLIIYSRFQNRAWKIRDKSMFAEMDSVSFTVDGLQNDKAVPIDGIAMDPMPFPSGDRLVYYTPLTGYGMYAISSTILKNEQLCKGDVWRKYILNIGKKLGPSDGMVMDNQGQLYMGILDKYGVSKWNSKQAINESTFIDQSPSTIIWPDSFAFDSSGFLYVLTNQIHKFFNPTFPLSLSNEIKFRLLRIYTGTNSYLYL